MPTTNAAGVPRPTLEVAKELKARLNALKIKDPQLNALYDEMVSGLWRFKLVGRAFVVLESILAVGIDKLEFPNREIGFVTNVVATMMAESGGKRLVQSKPNKDGSYDLGAYQINSRDIWFMPDQVIDFKMGAEIARRIMQRRINIHMHPLSAWNAYNNNKHIPWIEVALEAATYLEPDDKLRL